MNKCSNIFAGLIFTFAISSAFAAEITSLSNASTYTIPDYGADGSSGSPPGPETIAPGIVWTEESSVSLFGYSRTYGFGENGKWDGVSMYGTNSEDSSMTISFATPVQGVAAFMNYAPFRGNPVISVYDKYNNLLESTTLSFSAIGSGEVHGFLESAANISHFKFSGAYLGASNLQVAAVPEPESYAMLLAGLGLMGGIARRCSQRERGQTTVFT